MFFEFRRSYSILFKLEPSYCALHRIPKVVLLKGVEYVSARVSNSPRIDDRQLSGSSLAEP